MPHDLTLLRRYVTNRDEAAFRELVECHLDAVYSMALRRVAGDSHLAEDIAQQVFTALARQAESLSNHSALTGWLYIATRNAAANAIRAERRRKSREKEVFSMPVNPADERSHAELRDLALVLDSALDRLHETDRLAVLLRFVDELEFGEIAAALRVTEWAARKRVDRAVEKLRSILASRGIGSSAAAITATLSASVASAAPAGLAVVISAKATAASLGGTSTALVFMGMTKTQVIAVGLVTAAAVIDITQWRANSVLRTEVSGLRASIAHISSQPISSSQSPPSPIGRAADSKLAEDSNRIRTAIKVDSRLKPGLVPIGLLKNRGNATPAAAFESVQWALANKDMEALKKLIGLSASEDSLIEQIGGVAALGGFSVKDIIAGHEMDSGAFSNLIGLEVETEVSSAKDIAYLSGRRQLADGQVLNFDAVMRRTSDGWKWFNGAPPSWLKAAWIQADAK